MIFPSGNRKNLDAASNPLDGGPVSPYSKDYVPELKKDVRKKKASRHEFKEQAATKMSDVAHNVLAKGNSIGSAQAGGLSDIGGTVRQMRTATSNSIWDTGVLDRILAGKVELDKGEQIKADNKKVAEARETARQQQLFNIDPEAIKAAMGSSKSVSATSAHANDSSNYGSKVAGNQLSIFDANKFANVPELTEGEKIKKAAAARRDKTDRSWEAPTAAVSSKQKLSAFFDALKQTEEGK
jgi:hypothetical protein